MHACHGGKPLTNRNRRAYLGSQPPSRARQTRSYPCRDDREINNTEHCWKHSRGPPLCDSKSDEGSIEIRRRGGMLMPRSEFTVQKYRQPGSCYVRNFSPRGNLDLRLHFAVKVPNHCRPCRWALTGSCTYKHRRGYFGDHQNVIFVNLTSVQVGDRLRRSRLLQGSEARSCALQLCRLKRHYCSKS